MAGFSGEDVMVRPPTSHQRIDSSARPSSGRKDPARRVRKDTAKRTKNGGLAAKVPRFSYSPAERIAIDRANKAFGSVIEAVDSFEDIETWVPPLVRGVRALRDRAKRETGAQNYHDQQYRAKFGDLLAAEPIGPWLLDKHRHSLLDAVHYLGSDDTYLNAFMDWRRTQITEEQRAKWRALRTLVEHFKRRQSGLVKDKDRRSAADRKIELVLTESHKVDAARLAEVSQARQELATLTIKTTETLWTILHQAGPEMVVQALRDQNAKPFARSLIGLINPWLREPSP